MGRKPHEIDLLALSPDGRAIYAEVKWSDGVDCPAVKEELREKSLPHLKLEAFYVFAKSFAKREEGCFDLGDVERIVEQYGL